MNVKKCKVWICSTIICFIRWECTAKPSYLPIKVELRSEVYDSHVDKLCLMGVLWVGSQVLDSCIVASEEFNRDFLQKPSVRIMFWGFTSDANVYISCVNLCVEQKVAWKQRLLFRIQIVRSFFFHNKILNKTLSALGFQAAFFSCICSIASVCSFVPLQ